jgi:hypothetical protein
MRMIPLMGTAAAALTAAMVPKPLLRRNEDDLTFACW